MNHKAGNTPSIAALARWLATAVGLALVVGCAAIFVAVRPLNWPVVWLGNGAGMLGGDLLHGGLRGSWPVTALALLWLVP